MTNALSRIVRVDWDLDELLSILGSLNRQNLLWFLQPMFPNEIFDNWKEEELLDLALTSIQQWEKKCEDKGQFLVTVAQSMCRASFEAFVRFFWDEVPGSQSLLWNWNLNVYCDELQTIAIPIFEYKPRPHDLICNVPPGTSKSTVWSILFPCWVWTRMPKASLITASHTDSLVTDLASKSRDVMYGNRYKALFPEIQFSESLDSKGHYRNTLGGERFTCTIAGKSPTGKHSHFCLPWDTPIITERGELPIGKIVDERLDVRVLGYNHEREETEWKEITSYGCTLGRPLWRIEFEDGIWIEATDNHPVYVKDVGYVSVEDLYALWEGMQQKTDERGEEILWEGMLGSIQGWRESSQSRQVESGKSLSDLRQDFHRGWESKGEQEVLQLEVHQKSVGTEEDKFYSEMSYVRDTIREDATQEAVLFQSLCEQEQHWETEGQGQSKLHPRERIWGVSRRISTDSERSEEEGRKKLYVVRCERRESKEEGIAYPSHRLGQEQQYDVESNLSLPTMSFGTARPTSEAWGTSYKAITSIVRDVRLPSEVYNLHIKDTNNYFANRILLHNSLVDDPIDPKKVLSEAERKTAADFMTKVMPSRRMRGKEGDVSIMCLIMQRLGVEDPTDVMLRVAKLQGAHPVRHICLPAEITEDVSPPELRKYYLQYNSDAGKSPEGFLDPVRLGRVALDEQRAILGEYAYAGQFLQKPRPIAGGMFKMEWFNRRCVAAPFNARRCRYWDRAASTGESAAATAGTLMAYDGEKIYVEDVVHGRWEPDERNAVMLATAQKDRTKYGKYEPTIYVEAEGGSSGRDAWLGIVRTLIGFAVREDRVQGSKDTRAEPWATQIAAGNVWFVDNGATQGLGSKCGWDIEGFIEEHLNFRPEPGKRLGRFKDRVDSCSGAFNLLVGVKRAFPALQTIHLKYKKGQDTRYIVVCKRDELPLLEIDNKPSLILSIRDPEVRIPSVETSSSSPIITGKDGEDSQKKCETQTATAILPTPSLELAHHLPKNLGKLEVSFADVNPANYLGPKYDEPIAPWGQPVKELQLSRETGKEAWQFLFRKYDVPWGVLILVDEDDNLDRVMSVAYGMADALRLPRSIIHIFGEDGVVCTKEDEIPNEWIFNQIKLSKCFVVEN